MRLNVMYMSTIRINLPQRSTNDASISKDLIRRAILSNIWLSNIQHDFDQCYIDNNRLYLNFNFNTTKSCVNVIHWLNYHNDQNVHFQQFRNNSFETPFPWSFQWIFSIPFRCEYEKFLSWNFLNIHIMNTNTSVDFYSSSWYAKEGIFVGFFSFTKWRYSDSLVAIVTFLEFVWNTKTAIILYMTASVS